MKYLISNRIHKDQSLANKAIEDYENTDFFVLGLFDVASHFDAKFDILHRDKFVKESSSYGTLSPEVRWNFWYSWSLSDYPGKGLLFLRDSGLIRQISQINNLIGALQNPETHPEGDVFNHTVLAVDEAAKIAERENLSDFDRSLLIFSSLCHDFGKYNKQEVYPGSHAHEGVPPSTTFLESIGAPFNLAQRVVSYVEHHVSDYAFKKKKVDFDKIDQSFVNQLITSLEPANIDILFLLNEADMNGRKNKEGKLVQNPLSKRLSPGFKKIKNIYNKIGDKKRFSTTNLINMANSGMLDDFEITPGFIQYYIINKVNDLIDDGSVESEQEAEVILSYVFSNVYINSVEYCNNLDYRTKNRLAKYLEESNSDLDTLLLKGKEYIENILNTPSN